LIKKPAAPRDYRNFALITASFLLLLMLIGYRRHHTINIYLPVAAAAIALLGSAFPRVLAPVYRVWMRFGKALGYVNSRILLSIIFFLVLTPVALVRRVFNRDPLKLKWEKDADTYWEDAVIDASRDSLEHSY
jgi:hypothetical protein